MPHARQNGFRGCLAENAQKPYFVWTIKDSVDRKRKIEDYLSLFRSDLNATLGGLDKLQQLLLLFNSKNIKKRARKLALQEINAWASGVRGYFACTNAHAWGSGGHGGMAACVSYYVVEPEVGNWQDMRPTQTEARLPDGRCSDMMKEKSNSTVASS